jgi:hypothetical protein
MTKPVLASETSYNLNIPNPMDNNRHNNFIMNKKFWEELIAYFSSLHNEYLIRYGPHKNTASSSSSVVACVFIATGTCLRNRCLATLCGHRHTDSKVISSAPFYFFLISNYGLIIPVSPTFRRSFPACTIFRIIEQDGEMYTVNGQNCYYFSLTIHIRDYDLDSRVPETYSYLQYM